ncbi:hypothetical protein Cgig2_015648 [Carnegiea gigantea]|uniref:Uncharacterized protein n=1 Tax=Carnegiea gigantea TaxID=171969 RepID=A0A9Q1GRI4_9CARY|nr:hypothetical protein Cgig2_016475 [Carnegiea gigantea]KAJ8424122.1 hypothetical protein Cgig2_015648 [Carnegiea gigantea]
MYGGTRNEVQFWRSRAMELEAKLINKSRNRRSGINEPLELLPPKTAPDIVQEGRGCTGSCLGQHESGDLPYPNTPVGTVHDEIECARDNDILECWPRSMPGQWLMGLICVVPRHGGGDTAGRYCIVSHHMLVISFHEASYHCMLSYPGLQYLRCFFIDNSLADDGDMFKEALIDNVVRAEGWSFDQGYVYNYSEKCLISLISSSIRNFPRSLTSTVAVAFVVEVIDIDIGLRCPPYGFTI